MSKGPIVKHLTTKLPLTIETLRSLWDDFNESQRLEVIKSLIWTAPDSHAMLTKVQRLVASDTFTETID